MSRTTTAVLSHMLGVLFGAIAPLLIYFVSEDEYTKHHAWESAKFQTVLGFVAVTLLVLPTTSLLNLVTLSLGIVLPLIGGFKASGEEYWQYPLLSTTPSVQESQSVSRDEYRVEKLKEQYLNGELTDEEFERALDTKFSSSRREETDRDPTLSHSKNSRT